jgi:hypothetical protein
MDYVNGIKMVPGLDDAGCLGRCNHWYASSEHSQSSFMHMTKIVTAQQDGINMAGGVEDFVGHASIQNVLRGQVLDLASSGFYGICCGKSWRCRQVDVDEPGRDEVGWSYEPWL